MSIKMYEILIFTIFIALQSANAKNFQINELIDEHAINCHVFSQPDSKFVRILQDFSESTNLNVKLDKVKQILKIKNSSYFGIQGHQFYKTKHMEQNDLAVNFNVFDANLIKIAFQSYKTEQGESGIYYFVFKGSPVDVLYRMKKSMGHIWNIENLLEETAQGNSKLTCVYTG